MSVNELFDVSVLFESPAAASAAYLRAFGAPPSSAPVSRGQLHLLSTVSERPMPPDELDRRLCPPGQPLGGAFIGLKLGIVDAFSVQRRGGKSDQLAAAGGRMREASRLVESLISAGGFAVVLHKAAGTVKPAQRFLYELGDVARPDVRPWPAWLDFVATHTGSAFECRSYGMPHFFGEPNVRARLEAPAQDSFALERAMQATKYAAALLAADARSTALPPLLEVPVSWTPGVEPTTAGATTIPWTTRVSDDGLLVELSCPEFERHHLARRWDASPASVPGDLYLLGLKQALMRQLAPELALEDVLSFAPPPGQPAASLLQFGGQHGLTVLVTAGFGRHRAQSGDPQLATEYAEFCIAVPSNDSRFHVRVLTLGAFALTAPVPGGIKDFDGFPPGPDGVGFVVMPLEDIPLGGKRPLPLRQFVPVTAEEYAGYRVLNHAGRQQWLAARIDGWAAAARRWR